jgi:hypothetical protein
LELNLYLQLEDALKVFMLVDKGLNLEGVYDQRNCEAFGQKVNGEKGLVKFEKS